MNERALVYRRNRDLLWISLKAKEIYLREHESCLLLHFEAYEKMVQYVRNMIAKGYVIV